MRKQAVIPLLSFLLILAAQNLTYGQTNSGQSAAPQPLNFGEIFIRLYQETKESVVRITTELPPSKNQEDAKKRGNIGAGVIIVSRPMLSGGFENIAITNQHVIVEAVAIFVNLSETERYQGRLLNEDARHDLASVIFITTRPLKPAVLGDSDKLRIGEWVYAIGHPLLYYWSLTVGIVAGLHRHTVYDQIQYGEGFDPGNSGGGLFNLKGELVGIPHEAYGRNVGLAISVNVLKKLLPLLTAPPANMAPPNIR